MYLCIYESFLLSDAKFFLPFLLFGDEFPVRCPFSTLASVTHFKEKCRQAEMSVVSEYLIPTNLSLRNRFLVHHKDSVHSVCQVEVSFRADKPSKEL